MTITEEDRKMGSLGKQVAAAAQRLSITLPERWKLVVGRRIIRSWATQRPDELPSDLLDRAERLMGIINERLV